MFYALRCATLDVGHTFTSFNGVDKATIDGLWLCPQAWEALRPAPAMKIEPCWSGVELQKRVNQGTNHRLSDHAMIELSLGEAIARQPVMWNTPKYDPDSLERITKDQWCKI